jgi:hypothetical protein
MGDAGGTEPVLLTTGLWSWRGSESEGVGHGVESGFLGGEEASGGEASEGVAIAGVSADCEVDGFSHQSEDDGVFADIITGANGVVSDFAGGAFSGASFTSVNMILLAHLFGDDASELEGCAAGGIFLEAMVSFDDFDIDAIGVIAEDAGGFADEFHHQIDCGTHAGSNEYGSGLCGGEYCGAEFSGDSGGGDDERDRAGFADGEYGAESIRGREIDHDINALIE